MQDFKIKNLRNYKIIDKNNPYKNNTKEYFMVKFTLEMLEDKQFISTIRYSNYLGMMYNRFYTELSKEKNIDLELLNYDYNNVIEWGFWLCLNHNLIVEVMNSRDKLGIFFNNPFVDPIENNKKIFYNSFDKNILKNQKRILSYYYNNILTKKIKKYYNIPSISVSKFEQYHNQISAITPKISKSIEIEIDKKWTHENLDINNNERNVIHHTSDDYALFWAMKNRYLYVTYILSPSLLNKLDAYTSEAKNKVRKLSFFDFNYIYGSSNLSLSGTYSSHYYNKSSQEYNSNLLRENSNTYEKHWEIKSFVKKAGRSFELYTAKELEEKVKDDFLKYIPNTKNDFLNELKELEKEIQNNPLLEKSEKIEKSVQLYHKYFNDFPFDKFYEENQFFYKSIISKFYCGVFNTTAPTAFDKKENLQYNKHDTNLKVHYIDYILNYLPYTFSSFTDYFLSKINIYWNSPISHRKCLYNSNEKTFVVSNIIDMKYEYRIFVVNGKPVCSTTCYRDGTPYDMWLSGRFDPRLSENHNCETEYNQKTRDLVARYIKFAKKLCSEIKLENSDIKHYVLDVAYNEEKDQVIPIEINSINHSGLYMLNTHYLIKAIQKHLNPLDYLAENHKEEDFYLSISKFEKMRKDSWDEAKKEAILFYKSSNDSFEDIEKAELIRNKK